MQNYANYRGTNLLGHSMKLWERVIEIWKEMMNTRDPHHKKSIWIMGISTMEDIYLLERPMERYRSYIHMVFVVIDLGNTHYRLSREVLC